ncbi:F0F1 ATP synthase subunit beta [Candidatus Omnitrophota bacterium]
MAEQKNKAKIGRVISVQGPVVDVQFSSAKEMPKISDTILTQTVNNREITLEVAEHSSGNIARCISIHSTIDLQRNSAAFPQGDPIQIPVGDMLFGRIVNVTGQPIDNLGEFSIKEKRSIRRGQLDTRVQRKEIEQKSLSVMETGIKMFDLLFPMVKGSKTGILGGAALGKTILTLEMIQHVVKAYEGRCVFTGVGERIREGNELFYELRKHEIADKVMMVFGQMNEPPGARFGAAMTGITLAESIQRQNKDVLLFVDNIFRYIQAGAEISTLLGRVPSETGYQPTLIQEASDFHERIRSSQEAGGSITCMEAVYVPADDLTDPAVVAIFSFLDSVLILSRERIQLGLYPAIDPLTSSSANLDPDIVGEHHFKVAQEVIRVLQKYEELKRIVMVIGIDELSSSDRMIYERGRKLQFFMTQPFFVAEAYTGKKGEYVTTAQTVDGCQRIVEGHFDRKPAEEFYMIGALD